MKHASQRSTGVTSAIVLLLVCQTAPAFAIKRRRPAAPSGQSRTTTAPPVHTSPPPSPVPKPATASTQPTAALLAQVRASYEALDYDQIPVLAEVAQARADLELADRIELYGLWGTALVITNRPLEAEQPFRLLLRLRLDYEFPGDWPPEALAVFRKVQTEERTIAAQVERDEHARLVGTLSIDTAIEDKPRGGRALTWQFHVADPEGAVGGVRLQYRKASDSEYSTLPLRGESGTWVATLPGEWSDNQSGLTVDYFVSTVDREGVDLLRLGAPSQPLSLDVRPGTVAETIPIYRSKWFWIISGAVVAAAAVSLWLIHDNATSLPAHDVGPIKVQEAGPNFAW